MPVASVVERAVGKTTGAILSALARSYEVPGKPVLVNDPDVETEYQKRHLRDITEGLIKQLGYSHLDVQVQRNGVFIVNTFSEAFDK